MKRLEFLLLIIFIFSVGSRAFAQAMPDTISSDVEKRITEIQRKHGDLDVLENTKSMPLIPQVPADAIPETDENSAKKEIGAEATTEKTAKTTGKTPEPTAEKAAETTEKKATEKKTATKSADKKTKTENKTKSSKAKDEKAKKKAGKTEPSKTEDAASADSAAVDSDPTLTQNGGKEGDQKFTIGELEGLIDSQNNEVRTLREEYVQSLLDVKNAKAGMGPQIDLTVAATYLANPPIKSINLNVDELINSISWPSGTKPTSGQFIKLYDGMEKTYYNFQLEVTQPIFTWGKLSNSLKLYEEISTVKRIQIESRKKQLNAELKTRLVSLYYLQKMKEVLEIQDKNARRLVEICEIAEKNGMLLHQDVLDAKIKAQEIDMAQSSIQEQFSNVLLGVQRLTGNSSIKLENIDYIPDEEEMHKFAKQDRLALSSKAISREQDSFKMLKSLENISGYVTKIANASVYWKPDFAFKAAVGYSGARFPLIETDWYRKDIYNANFSLGMKTTIWDGGKKMNEIKRNVSKEQVAAINYSDGERSITQKLTEQFNTMDLALAKIEYQKLKIETLESKIAQQEKIFASGYGSENDLIQAKIEKSSAEVELLQNQLSFAGAVYTAEYLCGTVPPEENKDVQPKDAAEKQKP